MLSLLGASDPQAVQRHLPSLFGSCNPLIFIFGTGIPSRSISAMASEEGEVLPFRAECQAEGTDEQWLTTAESERRETQRAKTTEAVFSSTTMPRTQRIDTPIRMAPLARSQVWWTRGVEDASQPVRAGSRHALKKCSHTPRTQLNDLVSTMRTSSTDQTLLRGRAKNMIILDRHARAL